MKVITVLFLILLPILLSAEYEPKITVKHPFEIERDSIDPIADTLILLKDSLSRGTFLKMTIYDGLGHFAVDSGYASDSGTAHLSYNNWNDGSPIDTADIDSVRIELPNTYRFDETMGGGEPENPVEYYLSTSEKMRGTIGELIDKLKLAITLDCLDVQNDSLTIGDGSYSFKFAIMADLHIGDGALDFEGVGYTQEWQRTSGSEATKKSIDRNRAVRTYLQCFNEFFSPLKFVVALGDISESAERAELECARDLLDDIGIPYIPILGNHDTWAYYYKTKLDPEGEDRDVSPAGGYFKEYGFGDYYEILKTLRPFGNWNESYYLNNIAQDVEGNSDSYFFQFSFDYQNYHFICSDFNTRGHAITGFGGSNASVGSIYSQQWTWFWENFQNAKDEGREVIILNHHPLDDHVGNFQVQIFPDSFENQLDRRGFDYFDYWFAGHKHNEYTTSSGEWEWIEHEGLVLVDTTCKNVVSVGNSYAGWCKTVKVNCENYLNLFCTLNPSGENYVFEGEINSSPGSSSEYYFHLLNEDEMIEGSGAMNKTYEYTSTGRKTVTLDAVIDGSHYTMTKAFEIPYANYLVLENETVNTTETYEATNYIDAGTGFHVASSGDVTTEAGNKIYLKPGFQAQDGCKFKASIDESLKDNPPSLSSMESEELSLSIPKTKILEEKLKPNTASKKELIPKVFSCAQNYPNPFGDNTTINYGLPRNSHVKLTIFNLAGQAVRNLVDAQQSAGFKQIRWDGKNSMGTQVPQGIYFYTFKAGDYTKYGKMIMVK